MASAPRRDAVSRCAKRSSPSGGAWSGLAAVGRGVGQIKAGPASAGFVTTSEPVDDVGFGVGALGAGVLFGGRKSAPLAAGAAPLAGGAVAVGSGVETGRIRPA